jgi:hypothetical protein
MAIRFDYQKVSGVLGAAASNADFELVACILCARQYLVDHEHLRIYPDPNDLSRYFLNFESHSKPCFGCHQEDWDFEGAAEVAAEWKGLVSCVSNKPAA